MRGLSEAELLEIWERGITQALSARALSLLAAACPEMTPDQIATLSIGERDARLLGLRESLFGPDLEALVACPECGERLQLTFSTRELLSDSKPAPDGEVALSVAGYNLQLRSPNTKDLLAAGGQEDLAEGRNQILQSCLLSARCGGAAVDFEQLPTEVLDAAVQKIAEIDPLADIRMSVSCPACKHKWRAAFDIVSFLWAEVEAWSGRILNEVHTLASAYGWCERDILALSSMRRQFYLDMVGA